MDNIPNPNLDSPINSDFKDLTNSETKNTLKISKKSEASDVEGESSSENQSNVNIDETYIETFKDDNNIKKKLEEKNKEYDLLKDELEQIKQIVQTIQETPKTETPVLTKTKSKKSLFSSNKKKIVEGQEDPLILLQTLHNMFNDIKTLLKKMIEFINRYQSQINVNEQDNDDIKFYTSIIINSKNYFISSHKTIEKKLLYDLNLILQSMSKNKLSKIYKFNKASVDIISNNLTKIKDDVDIYKNNLSSNKPKWRKDDKNKQFDTIETEMRRCFKYHISINSYFYDCLKNELTFFDIKN